MIGLFQRLRRSFSGAPLTVPVLTPPAAHVERVVIGTGRDWKASPAVKPMAWSEDIAAHNAALDKIARLAVLDLWADALQGRPQCVLKRNSLNLSPDSGYFSDGHPHRHTDEVLAIWAQLYFDCQLAYLFSKRQNVTGLGKKMDRLTPAEVADAREASRLMEDVQQKERVILDRMEHGIRRADPFSPTVAQEAALEAEILHALGGEEALSLACHGNAQVMAQAKAKARELFAGSRAKRVPAADATGEP